MPQRTKRTKGPYSREQAEGYLFEELKRWRVDLGHYLDDEGGHPYSPSRTWNGLKAAHDKGELLAHMTGWLADYNGLSSDSSATSMTEIVKVGQRTWEHILLEPNKPWSEYVTDRHRQKLLECLRDCYARGANEMKLRADIQKGL